MYVEMRGVGSNDQTSSFGSGVGEFEMTVQRGGLHGEPEGRLQIRLLERGEHPAGVRDLELGVQVGLLVDRVDEAVQPLAGVGVRAVRDDLQLVGALAQAGQRDPGVAEDGGRVEGLTVQHDLVDGRGDQVDEGLRTALRGVEAHGGHGPVGAALLRSGEVEIDLVRVHGQQARPLLCLFAGQIRARHAVIS